MFHFLGFEQSKAYNVVLCNECKCLADIRLGDEGLGKGGSALFGLCHCCAWVTDTWCWLHGACLSLCEECGSAVHSCRKSENDQRREECGEDRGVHFHFL